MNHTKNLIELFTDASVDIILDAGKILTRIDNDLEAIENLKCNHRILIQHIRDLRLVYFCQTGRFLE